jgi:hypothetical protein
MQFLRSPSRDHMVHPDYETMRLTVIYLVEHALGRESAVPENTVVKHLKKKGFDVSIEYWRQSVLEYLLENVVFVGVCESGVFLIIDEQDAQVAEEFLEARVDRLVRHLAILRQQAETAGLLRVP